MLPNWLYGKSKSKLASILGGGGGIPADYNQVKAQVNQNTEDILLLNNALDDKAALTQITNPNLLDNPWFTVNQRGQSSYPSGYGFDRWLANTISKNNDVITFTTAAAYAMLHQHMEKGLLVNGEKYTLSFLDSNGVIHSATFTYDGESTGWVTIKIWTGHDAFYCTYQNEETYVDMAVFDSGKANQSVSFKAVKLEKGSVSTLAMDTAPNYQQELAKCQRYFQRLTGVEDSLLGVAFVDTATRMDLAIATPALIRGTTPTVTLTGTLKIGFSTTTNVSGMSLIGMFSNILSLNLTSENMTPGTVKRISWGANSYIDISADL